jgi:hypothetical protein
MRAIRKIFAVGAGFCFCALMGCSVDTTTTTNGRYQMSSDGTRLVDTTTGDVYDAVFNSNDGSTTWVKRPAVKTAVTKTAVEAPAPAASPTTAVASTSEQSPQDFGNTAPFADSFDRNLQALKAAHDEGNLTKTEYATARTEAIGGFESFAAQQQIRNWTATRLHDELACLAWMKKEGRLSNDEFERARSMIVAAYLPSGQR